MTIFAAQGAPTVSTTPAVTSFPELTLTVVTLFSICHKYHQHRRCTLSCQYLREFSKKSKWQKWELSGHGWTGFAKKPEVKYLVTLSLSGKKTQEKED
jgi:hypothetical protein